MAPEAVKHYSQPNRGSPLLSLPKMELFRSKCDVCPIKKTKPKNGKVCILLASNMTSASICLAGGCDTLPAGCSMSSSEIIQ